MRQLTYVIPAQAGIYKHLIHIMQKWMPLCTGMTIFLLLTGCFHLRGTEILPPQVIPLSIQREQVSQDWIYRIKQHVLHTKDITDDFIASKATLQLIQENIQKNILSIGSGGSPRQYQLVYTLTYALSVSKKGEIIPPTTIMITRISTINNERILGSYDEEERIIDAMKNDAAARILHRINAQFQTYSKKGQP